MTDQPSPTSRRGHRPRAAVTPGTPPRERAGAGTAGASLPAGPALVYVTSTGEVTCVDTEAVADPRERAIYRALAALAAQLADKADETTPDRAGFYA